MLGQLSAFPDVSGAELQVSLQQQLRIAARQVSQDFATYFDKAIREMVTEGLRLASADEGTIWLINTEEETLVPVFNSGAHADHFVGKFRQSLRSGMISMVVATEHPICENDVHQNRRQDPTLDQQLGVQTCAMIAAPFYFGGDLRGVLSGVQLRSTEEESTSPKGFSYVDLVTLQRITTLLGRLLEHRLILKQFGIEGWA